VVSTFPTQEEIVVSQNSGFMNVCGSSVRRLVEKYGVAPEQVCVVHDDIAFDVGDYRLQFNRNANGHHGVESIISSFGTKGFWRMRVGIGSVPQGVDQSEFVLSKLTDIDEAHITKMCDAMWKSIQTVT